MSRSTDPLQLLVSNTHFVLYSKVVNTLCQTIVINFCTSCTSEDKEHFTASISKLIEDFLRTFIKTIFNDQI